MDVEVRWDCCPQHVGALARTGLGEGEWSRGNTQLRKRGGGVRGYAGQSVSYAQVRGLEVQS